VGIRPSISPSALLILLCNQAEHPHRQLLTASQVLASPYPSDTTRSPNSILRLLGSDPTLLRCSFVYCVCVLKRMECIAATPSMIYINSQSSAFFFLSSIITHHSSLTSFITHTSSINNTNTMLFSTLIASLGLATAVSAITVTAPSNSTGWTSTGAQVIEWDVSPSFFSLSLPPSRLNTRGLKKN
jgi:hypothetical protein